MLHVTSVTCYTCNRCSYCYPDCETTTYSVSTSSAPFRPCSSLNAGLSELCQYSNPPSPPIWSAEVLEEYASMAELPGNGCNIDVIVLTYHISQTIWSSIGKMGLP